MELINRGPERRLLDELLRTVRGGESRVLVLHGDPGVGKSALMDYVAEQATDCRLARAAGIESEMELAYAALQQLCAPMLEHLDALPAPQREALGTAFGLMAGPAPDRFLVGLATLNLISEVAEQHPLVCLVDDLQWLDQASAQALAFVGRRLVVEPVAIIFASRVPVPYLSTLATLEVKGLRAGDARALLDAVWTAPIDERVRDQIVIETGGNPLALLELPRGLGMHKLAGGFGLPGSAQLTATVEESFRREIQRLPRQTHRLLLLAAAEPLGDPALLWRAAAHLGIGADAAAPAIDAGLAEFGVRVRFRHPLVRSAAYHSAPLHERRAAHQALAEATDSDSDPDRHVWHRAQATEGPDEDVAAELERSADRAQARGGLAAAAAFLERATMLTREPNRQAERALAAAAAHVGEGAFDAALELLTMVEGGPLSEFHRARVDLIRAQLVYVTGRGADAMPLLLKAAKSLEPFDVALSRATYLDALTAGFLAGELAEGDVLEVARAAQSAPRPSTPQLIDLTVDAFAAHVTDGYVASLPALRRATKAARDATSLSDQLRCLYQVCLTAQSIWDDESTVILSQRYLEVAREAGALAEIPIAGVVRAIAHVYEGELTAAESLLPELTTLAQELQTVTEAIGTSLWQYVDYVVMLLAAFRGDQAAVTQLTVATTTETTTRGQGGLQTWLAWFIAVLNNGLGRYDEAVAAAQLTGEQTAIAEASDFVAAELVEAAVRSGATHTATEALRRLTNTTTASATDWALGVEARARALLSDGAEAERLYCEAIDRLERTRMRPELARARLLYGEWLRREGRRTDARTQLHTAHDMFDAMGMRGFAERTRHELLATGVTAHKRTAAARRRQLTPQETQIAELAREGLTNPEIGARLFISAKTVQYHLSKVFTKLDISSRNQLDRVLPSRTPLRLGTSR